MQDMQWKESRIRAKGLIYYCWCLYIVKIVLNSITMSNIVVVATITLMKKLLQMLQAIFFSGVISLKISV